MDGQYHCQLLSSHHFEGILYKLAVDKVRQQLYARQVLGLVQVFKLAYTDDDF